MHGDAITGTVYSAWAFQDNQDKGHAITGI